MSFSLKPYKEDIGDQCRRVNSYNRWKWAINTTQYWQANYYENIWHFEKSDLVI